MYDEATKDVLAAKFVCDETHNAPWHITSRARGTWMWPRSVAWKRPRHSLAGGTGVGGVGVGGGVVENASKSSWGFLAGRFPVRFGT
jgi:hypothetical protein